MIRVCFRGPLLDEGYESKAEFRFGMNEFRKLLIRPSP
jgi:hypothetical protein